MKDRIDNSIRKRNDIEKKKSSKNPSPISSPIALFPVMANTSSIKIASTREHMIETIHDIPIPDTDHHVTNEESTLKETDDELNQGTEMKGKGKERFKFRLQFHFIKKASVQDSSKFRMGDDNERSLACICFQA